MINGVNLHRLGKRATDIYGEYTFNEICSKVLDYGKTLSINVTSCQSDIEGEIINFINQAIDNNTPMLVNLGAYTHYSYAIYDALKESRAPVVEVHISNIYKRENFRHKSIMHEIVSGTIVGFGHYSYILGLQAIKYLIDKK